jgi:hypothetical protein
MKSNPILEEVWRVKDELAREAGYDVDRFFENLRTWSDAHPHPGPVVRNAEALRRLAREPAITSPALALKEDSQGPTSDSPTSPTKDHA